MHITFVSSFLPRKCGIATYTRDLSLEVQNQGQQIAVVAMENPTISTSYTAPVVRTLRQERKEDYYEMVEILNTSTTDIVHIQHEFGLFGEKDGENILILARGLKKPFIVTLHTVPLTPTKRKKYIIQRLAQLSRKVVVMESIAKDRLMTDYGIDQGKIAVILHGAPMVAMKTDEAKKAIGFPNAFILLANNLLSPNKGIEYAVAAIAVVVTQIPHILFLIVGETHPIVKSKSGESYRNELMRQVKKLHLEKNVIFNNTYVSLEELTLYLAATDIYITPYLDPQQITSGTLSYALGAEKACIATEYVYAKEMLSGGKGILVPFADSDAIAQALIDLYQHPDKRHAIEKKLHSLSLAMRWPAVAQKHREVYAQVLQSTLLP